VGHKDRDLTINQILLRDYQEKCRSGGTADENHGSAGGGTAGGFKEIKEDTIEEEDLPKEEIEELLDAAEKENTR